MIQDGILLINKPIGISSHDVVNVLRKHYKTKKIGHAGTLDVEASGLLVCGINQGTKLLNELQILEKTYCFDVRFNQETDTLDHTGHVIKESNCTLPEWLELRDFMGTYYQVPPAYSAVKVNGKKLYEYARNQEKIPDVKPRTLQIYTFKQLSPCLDDKASFMVTASSGLYVRKLALDLAINYETVAHTTKIHRLTVGAFSLDHAVHLNALDNAKILSMNDALSHLPSYELSDQHVMDVRHGRPIEVGMNEPVIKCIKNNELCAIYMKKNGHYVAKRVFKGA